MALTKTIQPELQGITSVAAGAQSISSEFDVSGKYGITLYIDHALDAASAAVGFGTEYRVEVSEKASGNDTWEPFLSVNATITTPVSIAVAGAEAAGQTEIGCGASVPVKGDFVFFKNSTPANSEWAKVIAVGSNQFTIQDGLTNAQAAGTYYNVCNKWVLTIDCLTLSTKRIRVVCNNNAGTTNQNIVWRCALTTIDSI